MVETASNSLLSSSTSDSSLSVQLHPLVLLTISDYITRHSVRQQEGPIIGAIIGQQNGRQITMEQAFQCKTKQDGDRIVVDDEWFAERLEQCKFICALKTRQPRLIFVRSQGRPQGTTSRSRRHLHPRSPLWPSTRTCAHSPATATLVQRLAYASPLPPSDYP